MRVTLINSNSYVILTFMHTRGLNLCTILFSMKQTASSSNEKQNFLNPVQIYTLEKKMYRHNMT